MADNPTAGPPRSCATAIFGGAQRPGAWRVWLQLGFGPVSGLALSWIWGFVATFGLLGGQSSLEAEVRRGAPYFILVNSALEYILLLSFMWLDRVSSAAIGWPVPFPGISAILREVAVGLGAGVLLSLIHIWLLTPLTHTMTGDALLTPLGSLSVGMQLSPVMLVALAFGSFVEEQVYRGYALVRLTERISIWLAIVSMALFFGLAHIGQGVSGMLIAACTGFNLALLFAWRRSLVSAVLAHFVINVLVIWL